MMSPEQYIEQINLKYKAGIATEHTFRGVLEQLIESIVPEIRATNEPKRQSCGAPDYIITRRDIPVGFIEAKDIGDKDLEGAKKTGNKEQFDRYKASLNNLIFTDYLDFYLYREGQFVTRVAIGEITEKGIKAIPENFGRFINLIKDFCTHIGQTIKSSKKLAIMMAGKARLLSDVIEKALTSDESNSEDSTLKDQMSAFKQILIHDITPRGFADVYAQTIAYGLFAARLHDATLPTFSRQEAFELIPKSNPFLKKLFGYIAGLEVDDRIKWIVDDLVTIFLACNVDEMLKNYGKATKTEDPIIHFYEDFLSEYDPKLRKARGVWYTPAPVVNFIVRAVDDILKTEFDLPQGLADTSKTKIKVDLQGKKIEQEVHKVQILDPATGTGTFLAEVIRLIYKKFEGQQGIWSNYVETHLLPRLNGFELLMASYAMAHLKLDLLLKETGYASTGSAQANQRLRVYLTNSLEEYHQDTGTLFANWLSTEANEANHIKRDTPVMCVIGNPPYSGISSNNGEWISKLIEDYKYVDGVHFNERKHWLNDDYVKFIRYGQHFIEKNGSGVLAFINPHGFLDNPTFRGMRWHLLKTYDKIYTIDLHGNSKKKETAPDGSADVNVFDIMQGVSINLFIKTGKKKANELGKVFHFDLYGKREMKYDFLVENSLKDVAFQDLKPEKPFLFFVPKNEKSTKQYDQGFQVSELFNLNKIGICTQRDSITIQVERGKLVDILIDLQEMEPEDFRSKYKERADGRDWKIITAKSNVIETKCNIGNIRNINYRVFDKRWTYYTNKSKGFMSYPRYDTLKHLIHGKNYAIVLPRQLATNDFRHIFITNEIFDQCLISNLTKEGNYAFPLYLYPETSGQQSIEQPERVPNLNAGIVNKIAAGLGLRFVIPPQSSPPFQGGVSEGRGEQVPTPNEVSEGRGGKLLVTDGVSEGRGEQVPTPNEVSEGRGGQYNNLPYLKTFRKELRNNLTPAEAALWKLLQGKQFEGRKFRRQHSVGNYILDFYCPAERIGIELDGQGHFEATQAEYDRERDLFLENYGIKILRFENRVVWEDPDGLLEEVRGWFGKQKPLSPSDSSPWQGEQPFGLGSSGEGEQLLGSGSSGEGEQADVFTPEDILDYIYAVLHSPTYREKYKEFLKIDFPRVPYPKNKETFWQLVSLGNELRHIHLLESPVVEQYITQYPADGNNIVIKPRFEPTGLADSNGRVYINDSQYFDHVPEVAWNFYIGGYQPAQKWLKDRKERKLEFEDILHYQKIIVALTETDRIMKEIDKIEIE